MNIKESLKELGLSKDAYEIGSGEDVEANTQGMANQIYSFIDDLIIEFGDRGTVIGTGNMEDAMKRAFERVKKEILEDEYMFQ